MYRDAKKKTVIYLILAAAVIAVLAVGIAVFTGLQREALLEEGAVSIRETVEKAARQCYVVEGVYPPTLAYMEENYGLKVNTKDYYITYSAFASNLPPTIIVTVKPSP